jgi:hypothetical protein
LGISKNKKTKKYKLEASFYHGGKTKTALTSPVFQKLIMGQGSILKHQIIDF